MEPLPPDRQTPGAQGAAGQPGRLPHSPSAAAGGHDPAGGWPGPGTPAAGWQEPGPSDPGQPYAPRYPAGGQAPYPGNPAEQAPYGGGQAPYPADQYPQHPQHAQYPQQPQHAQYPQQYPQQPQYPVPPRPKSTSGLAIVGIVVAAVVLLGGLGVAGAVFFSHDGVGGAAGPTPPISSPTGRSGAATLKGTWEGTYDCGQGRTRLRLNIENQPSGGTTVEAIFAFSSHPSNPSVPSGAYEMRGSYVDGALELDGVRWLDRPDGYQMVGLSAKISQDRPTSIQGTIRGSGCSVFSVERRS